jgi:hypothetical protein
MTATMPRPRRKGPATKDEFVTFSIRVPGPLYNWLDNLSNEQQRTLSAQVVYLLLAARAAEKKP